MDPLVLAVLGVKGALLKWSQLQGELWAQLFQCHLLPILEFIPVEGDQTSQQPDSQTCVYHILQSCLLFLDLDYLVGLVVKVSASGGEDSCKWMRMKVWSATSISVWQHVKLSVQIQPWDTIACCWDVKQSTTFWICGLNVTSIGFSHWQDFYINGHFLCYTIYTALFYFLEGVPAYGGYPLASSGLKLIWVRGNVKQPFNQIVEKHGLFSKWTHKTIVDEWNFM